MEKKQVPKVMTFKDTNQPVRIVFMEKEPWFVAKDVCDVLGIENNRNATSRLDDDEKGASIVRTPSGEQQMTTVNESGLYNLIFQSRKQEAKAFRKWVTAEVLPQIRKTGTYSVKRGSRRSSMLFSDPVSERKSCYPIDRGASWRDFYVTLMRYTTKDDIDGAVRHSKKPRYYVLEVLRGRKMSWRVLEFLTERAQFNKVYGIEGHLPVSVTNPGALRQQKESAMLNLLCQRTPKEVEDERHRPVNDMLPISFPIM